MLISTLVFMTECSVCADNEGVFKGIKNIDKTTKLIGFVHFLSVQYGTGSTYQGIWKLIKRGEAKGIPTLHVLHEKHAELLHEMGKEILSSLFYSRLLCECQLTKMEVGPYAQKTPGDRQKEITSPKRTGWGCHVWGSKHIRGQMKRSDPCNSRRNLQNSDLYIMERNLYLDWISQIGLSNLVFRGQ